MWKNLRITKRVVKLSHLHKNDGEACTLLKERLPAAFCTRGRHREQERFQEVSKLPQEIEKLVNEGYEVGEMTLSCAIAQCKRSKVGQTTGLEQAFKILDKASSLKIPHDSERIKTSIISVASSIGNLETFYITVKKLGINMSKPSIVVIGDLLKTLSICKAPWEDIQNVWKDIEEAKLQPTMQIFHAMMKCSRTISQMTWVFNTLTKYDYEPDVNIIGAAIATAGVAKRFDVAGMLYNKCLSDNHLQPNMYVRTSLLYASISCKGESGIDFAIEQIEKNFEITPSTLQLIISSHPSLKSASSLLKKYNSIADDKVRRTLECRKSKDKHIKANRRVTLQQLRSKSSLRKSISTNESKSKKKTSSSMTLLFNMTAPD